MEELSLNLSTNDKANAAILAHISSLEQCVKELERAKMQYTINLQDAISEQADAIVTSIKKSIDALNKTITELIGGLERARQIMVKIQGEDL